MCALAISQCLFSSSTDRLSSTLLSSLSLCLVAYRPVSLADTPADPAGTILAILLVASAPGEQLTESHSHDRSLHHRHAARHCQHTHSDRLVRIVRDFALPLWRGPACSAVLVAFDWQPVAAAGLPILLSYARELFRITFVVSARNYLATHTPNVTFLACLLSDFSSLRQLRTSNSQSVLLAIRLPAIPVYSAMIAGESMNQRAGSRAERRRKNQIQGV